jgi:hypothetical protein
MPSQTIKEDLINDIINTEWRMFINVPNIGGKAACQQDYRAFEINRSSQATSWSVATLKSYLNDLTKAAKSGRNLLTEKYARMMQSTSPSEYADIEHLIPHLESETLALIDKIVQIILEWEEVLSKKYPYIIGRGRPLHSSDDTPFVTSVETYLRGELGTYSLKTLTMYYENILQQKSENVNGSEVILHYMMKQYGYDSLEEANEKLTPGT